MALVAIEASRLWDSWWETQTHKLLSSAIIDC